MIRISATLAMFASACSIQAQEPLNIKSFVPGMAREAALAAMPRLQCFGADMCILSAPTVCKNIAPGHADALRDCLDPYMYGGRMPVSWTVKFHQDRLVWATVTIAERAFTETVEALLVRFGPALSDTPSVVQNRMGAAFDQRTITWSRGGATLRATRRSSNLEHSTITLTSDEYAAQMGDERKQSAKDRAKGM